MKESQTEPQDKLLLTYPESWNKKLDAIKKMYGMKRRQDVLRYVLAGFLNANAAVFPEVNKQ